MGGGEESIKIEEVVVEMLSVFEKNILPHLLSISEETKRYLVFIAWINTFLEQRGLGKVIITGGFAVEVYTGRVYRTMDVDIIVEGSSRIVELFLEKFSERIGRGYLPIYEILSLKSIDIVSSVYNRRKEPVKLIVEDFHVYLDPVEDLIAIYLDGWKYWGSTEDRDKALWLLYTWRNKLDWGYLEEICRERNVTDKLIELKHILN